MYPFTINTFGKFYSLRDVFECTGRYWALEDDFYYQITPCDRYNNQIVQTMAREWNYRVNKAKNLVDDL